MLADKNWAGPRLTTIHSIEVFDLVGHATASLIPFLLLSIDEMRFSFIFEVYKTRFGMKTNGQRLAKYYRMHKKTVTLVKSEPTHRHSRSCYTTRISSPNRRIE